MIMKEVILEYQDTYWTASATPPVELSDKVIQFRNASDRPCQITFQNPESFGLMGICLAPGSTYDLTFRGIQTIFQLNNALEVGTRNPDDERPQEPGLCTDNPLIPPGHCVPAER